MMTPEQRHYARRLTTVSGPAEGCGDGDGRALRTAEWAPLGAYDTVGAPLGGAAGGGAVGGVVVREITLVATKQESGTR